LVVFSAFSSCCAFITVKAVMLTMSSTVPSFWSSATGRQMPSRNGPTALAPPRVLSVW